MCVCVCVCPLSFPFLSFGGKKIFLIPSHPINPLLIRVDQREIESESIQVGEQSNDIAMGKSEDIVYGAIDDIDQVS